MIRGIRSDAPAYLNTEVNFEFYVTRIKESYNRLKDHGEVHNDSQKVQKLIRGIRRDASFNLHTTFRIIHIDTAVKNDFNFAPYVSTKLPNVISSEETEEEELGKSQVSPVLEDVAVEEEGYLDMGEVKEEGLDMDKVKEGDLDMEKIEEEEAVEVYVVAVAVVVEAMEEEAITIVTTKMEGIITIMELIHQIL